MSGARWTLAAPATLAQDVRKSRFIAHAAPATSPDEALAFITGASDSGATHNCWAYRIGQQYRFNDNGEPAGTAGKPILQAIDGQGIDAVAVVVTRWFGGIKLGAGGLARAYGGCAAECLRGASRRAVIELCEVEFALGFAELPLLRARLTALGATTQREGFSSEGATLRLRLPSEHVAQLRALVADLSRGRSDVRRAD